MHLKNSATLIAIFALALLSFQGLAQDKSAAAHNSQSSLDWQGTYTGVMPCADCEGIKTTIVLYKNHFTYKMVYLGKGNNSFKHAGTLSWNAEGNTVLLLDTTAKSSRPMQYLVGENTLTQLDGDGNRITGPLADKFILHKTPASPIVEKYWKLTELYGKPVSTDSGYTKEPHIIFKREDSRVAGNAGCNNFGGTYTLKGKNGISLSKLISTQMVCMKMEIESGFHKALQSADNYSVKGDSLILRQQKTTVARFVAVYMH